MEHVNIELIERQGYFYDWVSDLEIQIDDLNFIEWLNNNIKGKYSIQFNGYHGSQFIRMMSALWGNGKLAPDDRNMVISFGMEQDAILFRLTFNNARSVNYPTGLDSDLVDTIKKKQYMLGQKDSIRAKRRNKWKF